MGKECSRKLGQASSAIRQEGQFPCKGRGTSQQEVRRVLSSGRATFHLAGELAERSLTREDTHLRQAISAEKRIAITLHWLGHGIAERQLASIYRVGASTVNIIIHEVVKAINEILVPNAIVFPRGEALAQDMEEFRRLSKLKCCAGALDGTFMCICKPVVWGDHYWCYKYYCAIVVLATVNPRGEFTFVDAGRAGSLGDAYTFNHSRLKEEIVAGKLLNEHVQRVGHVWVRPYLVADSAFALSSTLMKGYPRPVQPANKPFNDAVISARKTVEMGFGGAKRKFHILMKGGLIDPEFAADVALSCCALHNVCSRASRGLPYLPQKCQPFQEPAPGKIGKAKDILDALASHLG